VFVRNMDALAELAKATGCAADGAAMNPMANLVESFAKSGHPPPRGVVPMHPRPRQNMSMGLQRRMDNSRSLRDAFHNRTAPHHGPIEMNPMIEEFQRARIARNGPRPPVTSAAPSLRARPSFEAAWSQSAKQNSAVPMLNRSMEPAWLARGAPRPAMSRPASGMAWQQQMHQRAAILAEQQRMFAATSGGMLHPMQQRSWTVAPRAPHGLYRHEVPATSQHVSDNKVKPAIDDSSALKDAAGEVASVLRSNPDPKFQNSEFLDFMSKVNTGAVKIRENKVIHDAGDSATAEATKSHVKDGAKLLPWYKDAMADAWKQGKSLSSGSGMEQVWREGVGANPKLEAAWRDALSGKSTLEAAWNQTRSAAATSAALNSTWDDAAKQSANEYNFAEKNPHSKDTAAFAKGQAAFERGDIKDAIFYMEAAIQQDDTNAEAWRYLGQSHAENDQDPEAIVCLERAVERDPYNLPALLALGVSYVNELDHDKALKNLQAWVQHNPRFAGLEISQDPYSDGSLVDEVMQLMLKAQAHSKGDPDVLEVLGVLYNVSRDYDNAVKTFKDALARRPDDYSLWNKIGATLANSARSDAAMPSYHRALELRPKYARGYLNLGIAHANLNNYAEAARCYLTALQLNTNAHHIWSYLRIAFTCLDRFDLASLTDKRDVSLFEGEFTLPKFT